jgi:glutaminase
MSTRRETDAQPASSYVSTGNLPPPDLVKTLVAEAHERYKSNAQGRNSQVYPARASLPSELFGI